MKKVSVLVAFLILVSNVNNAQMFKINTEKTVVKWLGEKVTGKHFGKIKVKEGNFDVQKNKLNSGKIIVDMNSITCDDLTDKGYNQKLIEHLNSVDFFNVANFSTSTIEVLKPSSSGNGYNIKVTIKGISQELVSSPVVKIKDKVLTIDGKIKIDRTKFDIRYGSKSFFDNLGDKVIYDEFEIEFNIVANL